MADPIGKDDDLVFLPPDHEWWGSAEEIIEWARSGDLASTHEAISDMNKKARAEERRKVLDEVVDALQQARSGEIDQDWRSVIHRVEGLRGAP